MQSNFASDHDFDEYVEEQDRWIYQWSLPEHKISEYRLEKSAKYKARKLVEYIVMIRSENVTNHITVFHSKDKQSSEIWSGYVDSPSEYQVMMSAVNKFIEERK